MHGEYNAKSRFRKISGLHWENTEDGCLWLVPPLCRVLCVWHAFLLFFLCGSSEEVIPVGSIWHQLKEMEASSFPQDRDSGWHSTRWERLNSTASVYWSIMDGGEWYHLEEVGSSRRLPMKEWGTEKYRSFSCGCELGRNTLYWEAIRRIEGLFTFIYYYLILNLFILIKK